METPALKVRLFHLKLIARRAGSPQFRIHAPLIIRSTLQEIVSASTCMCDHTLVRPIPSKDDTISSRTAASINLFITQDGKFIIGSCIWEGEALVIFVLMRIIIAAHGGPVFVISIALLHSGVDIIL